MKRSHVALTFIALSSIAMLAGCTTTSPSQSQPAAPTPQTVSAGSPVRVASDGSTQFLEDAHGYAVYVFAADSPNHSNCSGACLVYWPAVPAPAKLPTHVAGETGTLGVLTRTDGTRQLTINGWPLYTYAADSAPGMSNGQGVKASGGLWWLVDPAGQHLTSQLGATTSTKSTTRGGY